MSNKDETFDWAGEAGAKFAEWNPTNAEGVNKQWIEFYGRPATDILQAAVNSLKEDGLDVIKARGTETRLVIAHAGWYMFRVLFFQLSYDRSIGSVLDIGCSTGGLLSIMEKNGFEPGHLHGVDLSPKAIELNKREHPQYNCQVVKDFRYAYIPNSNGIRTRYFLH